jgi:hypothetical protein
MPPAQGEHQLTHQICAHVIVDRAVKVLISEVPQGGPADKHTI